MMYSEGCHKESSVSNEMAHFAHSNEKIWIEHQIIHKLFYKSLAEYKWHTVIRILRFLNRLQRNFKTI